MSASVPNPRAGELTALLAREFFERPPSLVQDAGDLARWAAFRTAYHAVLAGQTPDAPLQLDIELNSTCQMRCAHCTHGQTRVEKRELPYEVFTRIIDEAASWGICSVKLNRVNEPLLRRDLARFIAYARSRGVLNVYMASNGLLLTQARARELIAAGLSKILVSLDATTPETFALMRRSTKLAEIEANVRGLLALRRELGVQHPVVRVNFLRAHENAHEFAAFRARWEGVADSIGFQQQVALPGQDEELFQSAPPANDATGVSCAFPLRMLSIDAGGWVYPCCAFSGTELPLGSAHLETLRGIWGKATSRAFREAHRAGRGLTNPVCARCLTGCATAGAQPEPGASAKRARRLPVVT